MRTLAAGNRKLLLVLNRKRWPTKLSLQTHPLAPLPTTTTKEAVGGPEHGGSGSNTVSTGLRVLPRSAHLRANWDRGLEIARTEIAARCPCDPRAWARRALAGLLALIGALALAGALPGPGATTRASAQPRSRKPRRRPTPRCRRAT